MSTHSSQSRREGNPSHCHHHSCLPAYRMLSTARKCNRCQAVGYSHSHGGRSKAPTMQPSSPASPAVLSVLSFHRPLAVVTAIPSSSLSSTTTGRPRLIIGESHAYWHPNLKATSEFVPLRTLSILPFFFFLFAQIEEERWIQITHATSHLPECSSCI